LRGRVWLYSAGLLVQYDERLFGFE
jgi:hypothetical protein